MMVYKKYYNLNYFFSWSLSGLIIGVKFAGLLFFLCACCGIFVSNLIVNLLRFFLEKVFIKIFFHKYIHCKYFTYFFLTSDNLNK